MIRINSSYLKYPLAGIALVGALAYPIKSSAQSKTLNTIVKYNGVRTIPTATSDKFVKDNHHVTPQGTDDPEVLSKAPSPNVMVMGKLKKAKIVVDLSTNTLYHYDDIGNTLKAYLIASGRRTGKKPTPTGRGVRVVSHIEYEDYKTAPSSTKRFNNPKAYGPRIIILKILDTKTGEIYETGEFIHGNNDPASLGLYVSGGCMRMDNDVIKELASQVKRGDIVIIK